MALDLIIDDVMAEIIDQAVVNIEAKVREIGGNDSDVAAALRTVAPSLAEWVERERIRILGVWEREGATVH